MNFITKFINNYRLNKKQKEVNVLYEKNGLTDEVLNKQISINKARHEMDIPDSKQKISKKWVQ